MKNNFGHRYDILHGGWRLPCPQSEEQVLVQPLHLRRVSPLKGSCSPPVMVVDYSCPICERSHRSLLTTRELDYDPLCDFLAPSYNLATKKAIWEADIIQKRWVGQLFENGRWPWSWHCPNHRQIVPGSPSRVRALEPGVDEKYLLHYTCPHCDKPNSELVTGNQLISYPPV